MTITITKKIKKNELELLKRVFKYLVSKGHRHVVYLTNDFACKRLKPFGHISEGIRDEGGWLQINTCFLTMKQKQKNNVLFAKYLSENYLTSAVIVKNESIALEIFRMCNELDINIPNDISVIFLKHSLALEIHHPYSVNLNEESN